MFDLVQSLTLPSGAVVVGLASALLAFVWVRLPTPTLRWLLALIVPLVISYSLYWLPVWRGVSSSEYSTWAPSFIAPWHAVGAVMSSLVVFVDTRRQRRRTQQGGRQA
jgi:hypothetical protein